MASLREIFFWGGGVDELQHAAIFGSCPGYYPINSGSLRSFVCDIFLCHFDIQ